MAELAVGDAAPDFTLASTRGDVSLLDLRAGRRLVLAFFFEAGTPTCDTELGMLRDAHEMIREFNAEVLAVSADSLDALRAYDERGDGLPFALASDGTLDVARAYGVVDQDEPMRARRAVFVIDGDGRVMLAMSHFQPGNLSQVEAIFSALGAEV